jgi:hypothetical protein
MSRFCVQDGDVDDSEVVEDPIYGSVHRREPWHTLNGEMLNTTGRPGEGLNREGVGDEDFDRAGLPGDGPGDQG